MKRPERKTQVPGVSIKKTRTAKPGLKQLEGELKRVDHKARFRKLLRSTIDTLIVIAAIAVLVAVLFLPVLRIYGSSMYPTLAEGQIVVSIKGANIESDDVVALYYGSKVLIKRCIATEYQWVDIDENGNVYVDGNMIDEPYLTEKAFGETNIDLPYQVPDNTYFVLGDNRETSIDSRNTSVGCIDKDDIVGKIVFRVWPLSDFGIVK